MYNVLLQKSQHHPVREKGVKPSAISDEQWLNIDELTCSTLMLSVVDSSWDTGYAQCMGNVAAVREHLLSKECHRQGLLAQEAYKPRDERGNISQCTHK